MQEQLGEGEDGHAHGCLIAGRSQPGRRGADSRPTATPTDHFWMVWLLGQWALSPIAFPLGPPEAMAIEIGDASDGRHSTQPDVRSELTEGACSNSLLKP